MTTYNKLQSTIATLEGVVADFKVMELENSDNERKEFFNRLSSESEKILKNLKNRVNEVGNIENSVRKESN